MPVTTCVFAPSSGWIVAAKCAVCCVADIAHGFGLTGRRTAGAVYRFGVAVVLGTGAGVRAIAVGSPFTPNVGMR